MKPTNSFRTSPIRIPQCAIAYWGEAMSLFRQLWGRPEESDLKNGWDLIRKGQTIGAKTQRERDYIDALAVFYRDYDKLGHEQRSMAYSQAMEKVYQRTPRTTRRRCSMRCHC